jgi:hypothetical protein
MAKVN